MEEVRKSLFVAAGAMLAAFGASLCCILPVAVALLGVGSAALGAKLEPLRPWLAGLTVLLLGFAFYRAYRPVIECAPDVACAVPASRRRTRLVLWLVTVAALALMAFPYYVSWLV
jgi:mercuric ion transport protein